MGLAWAWPFHHSTSNNMPLYNKVTNRHPRLTGLSSAIPKPQAILVIYHTLFINHQIKIPNNLPCGMITLIFAS